MQKLMTDIFARDFWQSSRIIEVGARTAELGNFLHDRGFDRYIGLAEEPEIVNADLMKPATTAGPHYYPYSGQVQIVRNNADVLILSGSAQRYLWSFLNVWHAQYILWSPEMRGSSVIAFLGMLKLFLRGRIGLPTWEWTDFGAGIRRLHFLLQNRDRRRSDEKRYVSPVTGIEHFFDQLRAENVNYAILRWFEDLPHKEPGKDIDVIVADMDVEAFDRLTADLPGIIQCDVYSVSGLPGSDYHGDPHLPPHLAAGMLERAVWYRGRYRVPSPDDYFVTLAFHAIYHKGRSTGIPSTADDGPRARPPSHDYTSILGEMAASLNIDVDITLEGLDKYFQSRGLRPHLDTIVRFTRFNSWASHLLALEMAEHAKTRHVGLCNFYIRERAIERGYDRDIIAIIESEGFVVLDEIVPDKDSLEYLNRNVRGGNWGRGKAHTSAGGPRILLVVYDPSPIVPSASTVRLHPATQNERIRLTKKHVRRAMNRRMDPSEHCNMLHTSDNDAEALLVLRALVPDRVDAIIERIDEVKMRHTPSRRLRKRDFSRLFRSTESVEA
jgi:hypothetical protein